MWIALVGSHSTGKSSVLTRIPNLLRPDECHTIQETARKTIELGYSLGKDGNALSYAVMISLQLRAERHALMRDFRHSLLLSDRTVLDAVAYARANRKHGLPGVSAEIEDMLLEISLQEARLFDLYAYFPVETAMEADGVRSVDVEYRLTVGQEIEALLDEFNLPSIRAEGNIEAKAAKIASLFADYRRQSS